MEVSASKSSESVANKQKYATRDTVTKTFLTSLSTPREISQPIKIHEGSKPWIMTADKYEISYNPETDKNHPYERWRRNRYLRCLVTREIARYLDRKTFITVSVREALIYTVFLILITIVTFGSFPLEKFYLSQAMTRRYTKLEFALKESSLSESTDDEMKIDFYDINTLMHVWLYQTHIAVKLLFQPFWYNQEQLYENKLIGLPQIRQIRVKNSTCETHKIMKINTTQTCYGPYTQSDEEKLKISSSDRLIEKLAKVMVWRPPLETGSMSFSGTLATYSGGGYVTTYSNPQEARQVMFALQSLKWYDRATRAIFNEFTFYNGNVNLFCIFKMLFEIPPTGGVIPTSQIYVKDLLRYNESSDFYILGCEIICMVFVVLFTIQKVLEVKELRMKLIRSFWNYIDIMILIMSYLTFTYNLLLYINVSEIMPKLTTSEYEKKYVSLDLLVNLHIIYSRCFALLIAFAFLRLIKYFDIIHSMYELQSTVSRAMNDILNYLILFFYIYFVFALVGLFLFGSKLEDFKTFPMALFSLMRYSIADFNYAALVQTEPICGPVFYFTFIFFFVFILAGIFLAILVSKYQEVRSEVSIGGAKTFLGDMLMLWFLQLLGRMECPWLLAQIEREEFEVKVKSPTEHVRHFLRHAGYSELEIELFFKKYDITDLKIEAMDMNRISSTKGDREAPPPLSQKDIVRYIVIQKLDYLESHYQAASKLIDVFLNKLNKLDKK